MTTAVDFRYKSDRVCSYLLESSNDRCYLLNQSMLVHPQPTRLYYSNDAQASSSAGNDLPTNRSKQGQRFLQCDRPAYLIE